MQILSTLKPLRFLLFTPLVALASPAAVLAQCTAFELAELGAPDAFANDELGRGVSIDGLVAVAGAPGDEFGRGSAYVWEYDGSAWTYRGKLTDSNGVSGDKFGTSVAVSGDTIVVGAYQPFPADLPGKVLVFEKPASGWTDLTETAVLTASDGAPNDNFGYAVDIDGDTIAVGAYLDDEVGTNCGIGYVFVEPSGGWVDMTETGKLFASDNNQEDQFGISVAVSGDTIVFGADRDSDQFFQAGSAYVFVEPAGGWVTTSHTAKLTSSTAIDLDRFGLAVGVSGDTVVVGTWGDDTVAQQSGAAFVYERPGPGWADMTETARLTASHLAAGDHLGWAVDIDGDVIAAGAPANLFDGSGYGTTYLYLAPAGGWVDAVEDASLWQSDAAYKDEVGLAVSISGPMVISGAHFFETGGYMNAGAAYLFGGALDCNGDAVLDACEIVAGTGTDADGDGLLDECSNIGTNYCTSSPNSSGSPARIRATGSTSVAANDLTLFAEGVPANQFGLFFYGPNAIQNAFGNGFRCVGGGVFRLRVIHSGPGGFFHQVVDLANPPQPSGRILPGSNWKFQAWFRDPPAGGADFDLSDGLELLFTL